MNRRKHLVVSGVVNGEPELIHDDDAIEAEEMKKEMKTDNNENPDERMEDDNSAEEKEKFEEEEVDNMNHGDR